MYHRCLYSGSVVVFDEKKFCGELNENSLIKSLDSCFYICNTCNKIYLKDSVPCQAVSNKLEVFNLPEEFQIICKLKVLIGKCILFKKVAIMRRREMKNMTGTICNIPVDNIDVTNLSPRTSHSSRLMNVKFKHKLEYHGYVLFEPVRPDSPWSVLSYLKQNNQFYKDALP